MQMAAARTEEAQLQMAGQYKALSGGRRRKLRGGAELSIPGGLVSAGGSDPVNGFVELDNLAKQAAADGKGDVGATGGPVGGRRRKTTARKHM